MAHSGSQVRYGLRLIVLAAVSAAAGCAGAVRQRAVPPELKDRAVISGLSPAVRTWGSAVNPEFQEALLESVRREREFLRSSGQTGPLPVAEFLAISGGGANGAFTAGLLNGWTAAGNRPQFKAVTGISTGALIAPFAFLGPAYDETLRKFYTGITTKDVLTERSKLAAIFDDALTDNAPLRRLIASLVDQKLLDAIAAEYRKGRLLMIGTTNLDAQREMVWNVGAIAASGHPRAVELVRDIMIASAAIPAAFPPVMIDVEVDGQHYQEMHVDGGTVTQVFLYPPSLKIKEASEAAGFKRDRRVYIIRNARFEPEYVETQRRTLSIAGRAVSSLIATQGIGDLYRTYLNARRDGIDYNLVAIPDDFRLQPREVFDREYMQKLFDVGHDMGRKGYPWQKFPPGFDEPGLTKP
ncbi:MAG: patatin-like phospholipase family protein [Phycisphaerae bacterium]|nr:patatin-like phospholipase family protein [Phycisphaerae bacterium]